MDRIIKLSLFFIYTEVPVWILAKAVSLIHLQYTEVPA
jgi:hypothetical protein